MACARSVFFALIFFATFFDQAKKVGYRDGHSPKILHLPTQHDISTSVSIYIADKMYPIRIIILLLFISFRVDAQQTRKILIIDTVKDMTGQFPVDALIPKDSAYFSDFVAVDTISPSYYVVERRHTVNRLFANVHPEHFPNLIMPIILRASATDLELPLDDSGGTLTIKGAFLDFGDTIRISKFTVYHNCLPDSLKIRVHWFWDFNDSTHKDPKHLYSKYKVKVIRKECKADHPDFGSISVNGKNYSFPIHIASVTDAGMYYCNGHKRTNKWRRNRYERRITEGKPYKYCSGNTHRVKSRLFAEVTIN
jgi:hypothetical protein